MRGALICIIASRPHIMTYVHGNLLIYRGREWRREAQVAKW